MAAKLEDYEKVSIYPLDPDVQEALRAEEFEIRYEEYDWNLNGHFSGKD